jgi:hypothetical protein
VIGTDVTFGRWPSPKSYFYLPHLGRGIFCPFELAREGWLGFLSYVRGVMELAGKTISFCLGILSVFFALWCIRKGYYPWKYGPVQRESEPIKFWARVIYLFGAALVLIYVLIYAIFFYHPALPSH